MYWFVSLPSFGYSENNWGREMYKLLYYYSQGMNEELLEELSEAKYSITDIYKNKGSALKKLNTISKGKKYTVSGGTIDNVSYDNVLTNGVSGTDMYGDVEWKTFRRTVDNDNATEIIIDLESVYEKIKNIDIYCANDERSGIFLPENAEISYSEDGKTYTNSNITGYWLDSRINEKILGYPINVYHFDTGDSNYIKARYIKVKINQKDPKQFNRTNVNMKISEIDIKQQKPKMSLVKRLSLILKNLKLHQSN